VATLIHTPTPSPPQHAGEEIAVTHHPRTRGASTYGIGRTVVLKNVLADRAR
jgi:hypothetical protein